MTTLEVHHFVPDGPESYLAIPGPLGVALRLHGIPKKSTIITASTKPHEVNSDIRLKNSKIYIYKKLQFGRKLALGFSPQLVKLFFKSRKNVVIQLHYSRSLTTAIMALSTFFFGAQHLVIQTHGSVKSGAGFIKALFDKIFSKILFKNAKFVIALQENEKMHLLKLGVEEEKILIIPNMLMSLSSKEVSKLMHPYNVKPKVIFVGHLRRSKQVLRFLEVAAQSKYSEVIFQIAGPDGGDLNALENRIKIETLTNVEYLGSLDWEQLSDLYLNSDVILSPALDAPFDLSFVDGIARGCVGVASKEFNNWQELQSLGVLISEDISLSKLTEKLDLALTKIVKNPNGKTENSSLIFRKYGREVLSHQWEQVYISSSGT